MSSPPPPVGTIAMPFTDVEGSTGLARQLGAGWPEVLVEHHRIVGEAISREGGHVELTEGDAFFATFAEPAAAARAAVAALRALRGYAWPAPIGDLARDALVTESVGIHRLKDFPNPEALCCAVVDGRGAADFPPPRAYEARPTNLPAGLPALLRARDRAPRPVRAPRRRR